MTKSNQWIALFRGTTFKNNVLRACPHMVTQDVLRVTPTVYSPLAHQLSQNIQIIDQNKSGILQLVGDLIIEQLPDHSTWEDLQGYANRSSYLYKVPSYYKELALAVSEQLQRHFPNRMISSSLFSECNNPFITLSYKPENSVRYENGICFNSIYKIDRNRFRTKRIKKSSFQVIGQMSIVLLPQELLADYQLYDLVSLNAQGKIFVDPKFVDECEVLIAGYLPSSLIAISIPLIYPELDCEYHTVYQKAYGLTENSFQNLKEIYKNQLLNQEGELQIKNAVRQKLVKYFISSLDTIADQHIQQIGGERVDWETELLAES